MAWSTIVFGYLVPFCIVAVLLTWNGYTPPSSSSDSSQPNHRFTVFPTAMSAPPGCVDRLRTVIPNEFPSQYPLECCICMESFTSTEVAVVTECNHVFHKQCCQEWLRQARTCPVCRMDIPAGLEGAGSCHPTMQGELQSRRLRIREASRTHLHHEVVSLLQIIRSRERRLRHRRTEASTSTSSSQRSDRSNNETQNSSTSRNNTISSRMEEGRAR